MNRWLIPLLITVFALIMPASGTATNNVTLQVLNSAGVEDPVEDVARNFVVQGVSDTSTELFVKYRAAGGAACAPSADSDSGTDLIYGDYVNGSFRIETARTWSSSGTVLFCMWLADYSSQVAPSFSRTVTFRIPNGSVSLATAPQVLRPNIAGTLTVSGASEAPRELFVTYRATGGAPCAPSPSSDSGTDFIDGNEANGSFSQRQTVTFQHAGSYLFCVWLRRYSSDVEPVGGTPSAFTVSVAAPPARCRVPSVVGLTLPRARARVRRAHCSVGRIIYQRSKRPRGRVIGQYPHSGTLRSGAKVHLFVSRGRR